MRVMVVGAAMALAACGGADETPRPTNALEPAERAGADAPANASAATPDLPRNAPGEMTARFTCDDGAELTMVAERQSRTVTLTLGGRTLGVVRPTPGAAGSFSGDGLELKGKGRDATLARPGEAPLKCTQAD